MARTSDIRLVNSDNNIISAGVQNVTLINSDGLTITESNVVYIDGVLISGTGSIRSVSSSEGVDLQYVGYEGDTTASSFKLILPTAVGNEGKNISIKKISTDGNALEIRLSGVETLDDDSVGIDIINYNDLILVYSNGVNWKIR